MNRCSQHPRRGYTIHVEPDFAAVPCDECALEALETATQLARDSLAHGWSSHRLHRLRELLRPFGLPERQRVEAEWRRAMKAVAECRADPECEICHGTGQELDGSTCACVGWVPKRTWRPLYIRSGPIPDSGRSRNHLTGEMEVGISVWEAVERDDGVCLLLPHARESVCVDLSVACRAECYEVEGDRVGEGADGEPLLTKVRIVRSVLLRGQRLAAAERGGKG